MDGGPNDFKIEGLAKPFFYTTLMYPSYKLIGIFGLCHTNEIERASKATPS